ncbi:MAG: sugar phosphate isomerase/epimerase [Acidaminococcus sp.]|jgi:sugar phosphate isomerase/epimerase|nr:sugar phosphate isomerase/epimerase [Acidaminococcus sp.]MCI2100854.1 sugar phosphate isomerase/epimerase [Acidaminococcus sp.]MCI2115217.1 sugar phosphate isomerase/epimerase [Acidaminococcus sp.]MCI2116650.1 sugar phosphate isomerase/epimerase [Acidaminococcus sp.]
MMKFGIETEIVHLLFQNKRIDAKGFIKKAAEFGYDGVILNTVEKKNLREGLGTIGKDTTENLTEIRDLLRKYHLYVEIDTRGTDYDHICHILSVAEFLGAERIRTFIMGDASTYSDSKLGGDFSIENIRHGIEDIKKIIPELKKRRIFLQLENHELETAEEMKAIMDEINSPWVGILFDPGNYLNAWQDPLDALNVIAPYVNATHMKDVLVCMNGDEPVITGAMTGKGSVNQKAILRKLLQDTCIQRLNIEGGYLYTGGFSRPRGTGGTSEFKGTFAVKEPPVPADEVLPNDYYLYDGPLLDKLMQEQMENMRMSILYYKNLIRELEKEKERM